jgi:hypothetical protein
MYFDSNQVNNLLNCINCNARIDEPKLLPCGDTICSYCVSQLKIDSNNNEFTCIVCGDLHEMPRKGLPLNKRLSEMLNIKPTRVSRGKLFNLLEESIKEIEKKINFFKIGIKNSDEYVKEYCFELRNEVHLATELTIEKVQDLSQEFIDQLLAYESELIEINKSNTNSREAFSSIVSELELFQMEKSEFLKSNKIIDDDSMVKLNEAALSLTVKADLEMKKLQAIILNGNIYQFKANASRISPSLIGASNFVDTTNIISTILTGKDQVKDLMLLCKFPLYQKWSLIYRASQDGFEAAKFHSKCDLVPNTLVLIKSSNGNVFGGYTDQDWTPNKYHKGDSNSFIFSFININHSESYKMMCTKPSCAISCLNRNGPIFGETCWSEIYIADKSNTNTFSYSNPGSSYKLPVNFKFGSNESKSLLAGSTNFQVAEIEVFAKQEGSVF